MKDKWRLAVSITPWALYSGIGAQAPIAEGPEWAQDPVWMLFKSRKFLAHTGIRIPDYPAVRTVNA